MARSRKQEIGVGVLLLVALVLLAYMSLKVGAIGALGERVHATVQLADAAGLTEGALVKLAGVEIGAVDELVVVDGQAQISLSIDASLGIRQDARAQVRARSVLGEKFLSLTPGSADAPLLRDGDVLYNTAAQVEIDQLLNAMLPLIEQVDGQALAAVLDATAHALQSDPDRVERMLGDLEVILENTAAASQQVPELLASAEQTLQKVDRTADQASPMLRDGRAVLSRLDEATVGLPHAVDDAEDALAEVRALIGETRTAVDHGDDLLSVLSERSDDIELIIDNVAEIDKWELRRLLREEGIRVRLRSQPVIEPER